MMEQIINSSFVTLLDHVQLHNQNENVLSLVNEELLGNSQLKQQYQNNHLQYKHHYDEKYSTPFSLYQYNTNDTSFLYHYSKLNYNDYIINYEQLTFENFKSIFCQILFRLRFLFYLVWPTETMFSSLEHVPRYVTEAFPVFFIVAFIENIVRLIQGRKVNRINESISSISAGIFQECLRIKVRSIEVLVYCLIYENLRLITLPWNSLFTWWLCYLSVDMGFYWAHRIAHEVNFVWAIHQAHHSSDEFSVISAFRQAVLQPFTAWFTYLPLALAIPPQVFLAHLQLSELFMAWLHTEVVDSLGPLEYILNTPSHHRVHHSRNPEYIDKNYGGMLIIWDRLFNTFKAEDRINNPPVYGLVHPIKTFNPLRVQFHTWPVIFKRMIRYKTFQNKLRVLFYGPGWRPGLARLGDPTELPKIKLPVESYDPTLSIWKNVYILGHFALLLFFYHELTIYQNQFSPIVLNIGVLSLLGSITSLGLLLDNKRRYCTFYELLRCSSFFLGSSRINFIITYGLEHSGYSTQHITFILTMIHLIFALSIIINILLLLKTIIETNQFDDVYLSTSKKMNNVYNIEKDNMIVNNNEDSKIKSNQSSKKLL